MKRKVKKQRKFSAKEIFFENDGQYYHMAHDGFWDDYKEYNVDKNTEEEWIKELINLRLKQFKQTSEIRYLIPLVEYYNTYEFLEDLLSVENKDTYINKLVIIELLTTLLCKNKSKILNYKDKKQIIKNNVLEFIEEKIPVKYEAYNVTDRIEKIKRKLRMK